MSDPTHNDSPFDHSVVRIACWLLFAAAIGTLAGLRFAGAWPAGDLTAYMAAADVYAAGGNPYGPALEAADRYAGYPYVYPPGTLPLIRPLAGVSTHMAGGLLTLLSGGLLVYVVGSLRRRFELAIPTAPLAVGALLFGPVIADLLSANLAVVMLAANVAVADLVAGSDDDRRALRLGALTLLGVVLSFKFMWLIPALVLTAAVGRNYWCCAVLGVAKLRRRLGVALFAFLPFFALITGPLLVAAASLLVDPTLAAWLDRLQWLRREFPASLDILSLAPGLYPITVGAATSLLVRCRDASIDLLWVAACCSVVAWPRLAPYSFALLLPALAHLARRLDPRHLALLVLPMWGPVYWTIALPAGSLHARWLHVVWAVLVGGVVWVVGLEESTTCR
jgi:hypothetical protein